MIPPSRRAHPQGAAALAVALAGGLGVGCRLDVNDPGTEPPRAQFYFPSGIAADPGGRYLYVSNGNSDLRYGGGTLQLVDLERFDCAVARYRDPLRADPGCPAAEADAAACVADPIDRKVVNCDASRFILPESTIRLGNFAGDMELQTRGDAQRRLFIGVRGDPSVTWVDVDVAEAAPAHGHRLSCFDRPEAVPVSGSVPTCDASHLLQRLPNCGGVGPDGAPVVGPACMMKAVRDLPAEPYGLKVDQGKGPDGRDYAHLLVTHLATGEVSLFDVQGPPRFLSISEPFFTPDSANRRGAYALAPQRAGDPASPWYMTSSVVPQVATFRVADADVVVGSQTFTLPTGGDLRDIAFEPGGQRAFLTQNSPPVLLVMDTRTRAAGQNGAGTPANQIVDLVDVCQSPSRLALFREQVEGAPGAASRTATRAVVACFLANQLMVIDPDLPGLLSTIIVGRGPNRVAIAAAGAPRAFVAQFGESTVGVVDLDPASPTRNRLVARIGIPTPLAKP